MAVRVANPNNFKYSTPPRFPGVGRLIFAGSWLLMIGLLNLLFSLFTTVGERRPRL
jgi:hypothetical protein